MMEQERARMRKKSFSVVAGKALLVGETEDLELASLPGSQPGRTHGCLTDMPKAEDEGQTGVFFNAQIEKEM